jgi:hypothetical protein
MEDRRTVRVQIVDGESCTEGELDADGRPVKLQPRALPRPRLGERVGAASRMLASHKLVVRGLVKLLYLFPLLLIIKLCFWIGNDPRGDYLTLAFVGLVLLFFLALAVYLVLFLFAGPPSTRRRGWRLDRAAPDPAKRLPPLDGAALRGLLEATAGAGPLRAAGRVRVFNASGEGPLLSDLWGESAGQALRVTSSRPFLVEDVGQPPLVVPAGVPLLLFAYEPAKLGADEESLALQRLQQARQLPPPRELMRLSLSEGSWLQVEAPHHRRVDSLLDLIQDGLSYTPEPDETAASPYRPGAPRPALLALAGDQEPIVLRSVKPSSSEGA